jgi:plastocyanin
VKSLTVAAALVLTLAAAGCSSDDADSGTDTAAPAESSSEPAAPSEAAPSEAAAGEAQALTGTVGTQDDPDAFEITLTDASGQEVTELPAGDYSITINDLSEIHNFHLEGGDVDETTTVPETGETTWDVTLTAGDYTAICDPHPNMKLDFTVT